MGFVKENQTQTILNKLVIKFVDARTKEISLFLAQNLLSVYYWCFENTDSDSDGDV